LYFTQTKNANEQKTELLEPIFPGEILCEEFMRPLDISITRSQTEFGNAFIDALRRRTTDLSDTEHKAFQNRIWERAKIHDL